MFTSQRGNDPEESILKTVDPDVEILIYAVDTILIIRINIIRIMIFDH